MTALSFVAMYILMYAMVDGLSNVYANLNQLYMAGLMISAMALLELVLMRAMYDDKRLNAALLAACALVGIGCWTLPRQQAAISDRQFLRSMIPHHAGALLMCEEAALADPAIKELCGGILSGQQAEIDFMKTKLAALGR